MKDIQLADFIEMTYDFTTFATAIVAAEVTAGEEDHDLLIYAKSKARDQDSQPILPMLKRNLKSFNDFDTQDQALSSIEKELRDWISFLNKKYTTKRRFLRKKELIEKEDGINLGKDLIRWVENLITYGESKIITNKTNTKLKIPSSLIEGLDKNSKADLKEAMKAMDLGLYTGSHMLFFRVMESEIKRLYRKATKTEPTDLPWGDMLENIYKIHHVRIPSRTRNIAYYLRDLRNEAQHPGKRFTKNDCEKIFHFLSELKKEVSKF